MINVYDKDGNFTPEFKSLVDLEEYRDGLLLNKVVDFLVENATITEVPEITE